MMCNVENLSNISSYAPLFYNTARHTILSTSKTLFILSISNFHRFYFGVETLFCSETNRNVPTLSSVLGCDFGLVTFKYLQQMFPGESRQEIRNFPKLVRNFSNFVLTACLLFEDDFVSQLQR